MVCSDHKWTPQDLALFEEQQKSKKAGAEKGKRKVRQTCGRCCHCCRRRRRRRWWCWCSRLKTSVCETHRFMVLLRARFFRLNVRHSFKKWLVAVLVRVLFSIGCCCLLLLAPARSCFRLLLLWLLPPLASVLTCCSFFSIAAATATAAACHSTSSPNRPPSRPSSSPRSRSSFCSTPARRCAISARAMETTQTRSRAPSSG